MVASDRKRRRRSRWQQEGTPSAVAPGGGEETVKRTRNIPVPSGTSTGHESHREEKKGQRSPRAHATASCSSAAARNDPHKQDEADYTESYRSANQGEDEWPLDEAVEAEQDHNFTSNDYPKQQLAVSTNVKLAARGSASHSDTQQHTFPAAKTQAVCSLRPLNISGTNNPDAESEVHGDSQASSDMASTFSSPFRKIHGVLGKSLEDFRENLKPNNSKEEDNADNSDFSGSSSCSMGRHTESVSPLHLIDSIEEAAREDEEQDERNAIFSDYAVAPLSTAALHWQQQQKQQQSSKGQQRASPGGSRDRRQEMLSQDSSVYGLSRPILQEIVHAPEEKFWDRPVTFRHPRTVLRKLRLLAGKMVNHPKVQLTIVFLIISNALIMGVETFDFVTDNNKIGEAFDITDRVFLCIFTVEISLQLFYQGVSLFFDGWLVFDFAVVVASWSLESLQVVRAFRVFRAFRLITRFGHLRELVCSIVSVMPRMYAITILLLLIFYIYGVLFTNLFGDLELSGNYFGSLDESLFTCMQLMTLEWAAIAREVMAQKSWAWLPFLSFISITGFIVFNLIVAVVCDAVSVTEQQSKAERAGPDDSDQAKLAQAERRIQELAAQIKIMKHHHVKLQQTVGVLMGELQRSIQLMQQQELQQRRERGEQQMQEPQQPQQPVQAMDDLRDSAFLDHFEMIIGSSDDNSSEDLADSALLLQTILLEGNSFPDLHSSNAMQQHQSSIPKGGNSQRSTNSSR